MEAQLLEHGSPQTALARRRVRVAVIMLTLCCLLWGLSFPLMQVGPTAFDRILAGHVNPAPSPLAARAAFNTIRYGLATLLYILVTLPHHGRYSAMDVRGGLVVGLFSGAGMFCQTVGLQYTTPSISAFITSLSVIFAPLVQALVLKRPVGGVTWIAIVVAGLGVTMLAQASGSADPATRPLTLAPPIRYLGEAITLLGTFLFTGQILAVDHYGRRSHPIRLTALMIAGTAGVNLAGGLLLGAHRTMTPQVVADLVQSPPFTGSMVALVVLCSLLALDIMNRFQPLLSPATATVIYCLEPLFGTGFSVLLATEHLTLRTALGGVIILAAVLLATRAPPASKATSHEVHHP